MGIYEADLSPLKSRFISVQVAKHDLGKILDRIETVNKPKPA